MFVFGCFIVGNMTNKIISGRAQPNATVSEAGVIYKTFRKLSMNATLSDLADALDYEPYGELCLSFPVISLIRISILVCSYSIEIILIFTHSNLALVITEQRCFAGRKKKRSESCDGDHSGIRSSESEKETMTVMKKSVVSGIVTRIDLLEFISKGPIE